MPLPAHLLLVRAGGATWALPMGSVEETLSLADHPSRRLPSGRILNFRGDLLPLHDLAATLGLLPAHPIPDAVVLWAAGRRCAFAVEGLLGQDAYELQPVPPVAAGRFTSGLVLHDDEPVAVLEPGALVGAWAIGSEPFALPPAALAGVAEAVTTAAAARTPSTAATEATPAPTPTATVHLTTAALLGPSRAADSAGAPAAVAGALDQALANRAGRLLVLLPEDPPERLGGEGAVRALCEPVAAAVLAVVGERTGVRLEPGRSEVLTGRLGTLLEAPLADPEATEAPVLLLRGELRAEAEVLPLAVVLVLSPAKAGAVLDALRTSEPARPRAPRSAPRATKAAPKTPKSTPRAKPAARRRPAAG